MKLIPCAVLFSSLILLCGYAEKPAPAPPNFTQGGKPDACLESLIRYSNYAQSKDFAQRN
jgi:hypothetical protein